MPKRAALVAESGAPTVNPTPRQVIPSPLEALNPTPSKGTGNHYCTAPSQCQPIPALDRRISHLYGTAPSQNQPIDGYRNRYCTTPLLVPACTGPTNGYRNLYCTTPPHDQPVPTPPTGTAIAIASPTPLSVSLYQAYQRVRQPLSRRPTPSTDLQQPQQRQLRQNFRLPVEQLLQQPQFLE